MTKSNEVSNVNSRIESISAGFTSVFSSLTDSWKGNSKDNIINKAQTALNELFNKITSQLKSLESAVKMATKYKELKKEYERLEQQYNSIKNDEESAEEAAEIYQKMMKIKKEMDELKKSIQSLLDGISGEESSSSKSNSSSSSSSSNSSSSSSSPSSQNSDSKTNKISASSSVLNAAEDISDVMVREKHTYSTSSLYWNDIDKSLNHSKTCCATYVSSVLYKSGIVSKDEINSINYNLSSDIYNHFKNKWNNVTSINDLQAGDIVFMSSTGVNGTPNGSIQHVQIYAGNGEWYNAGSTGAIQRGKYADSSQNYRFIAALRPSDSK